MPSIRRIIRVTRFTPAYEGAGVRLRRAFAHPDPHLDPFLLLDDFGSDDPADYIAGFPWHPHRGIETITYVLRGRIEHGDSLGHRGIIEEGDVQWMTAGSGIIHEEMPPKSSSGLRGFQLWANLPAAHKMTKPRYREAKASDIPQIEIDRKIRIKVISGKVKGVIGPVCGIVTEPTYLDVRLDPDARLTHELPNHHNAFAYVVEGEAFFTEPAKRIVRRGHLVVFDRGGDVRITTAAEGVRFLLIAGKPIGEPVVWRGPIVMNTEEEVRRAFEEYENGAFIKSTV